MAKLTGIVTHGMPELSDMMQYCLMDEDSNDEYWDCEEGEELRDIISEAADIDMPIDQLIEQQSNCIDVEQAIENSAYLTAVVGDDEVYALPEDFQHMYWHWRVASKYDGSAEWDNMFTEKVNGYKTLIKLYPYDVPEGLQNVMDSCKDLWY
jgi:hypothetical protein